jgi:hypothetical protein
MLISMHMFVCLCVYSAGGSAYILCNNILVYIILHDSHAQNLIANMYEYVTK